MNRREWVQAAAALPVLAGGNESSFDPDFGSAGSAAEAIRQKKISSEELTRHALGRVAQYNPRLNAIVMLLEQQALEQARAADRALSKGRILGPLHGVPVTIKESFQVEGTPTTWGHKELLAEKSTINALAVQRLIDSGVVILGKTNIALDLMDWQSRNVIWGVSNNPWDLKRTPGGSTSGGAAATSAGLGFLALGSDIGGSIRIPAHFCGVYGHKPTLNIVPVHGHRPGGGGNGTVPPMDLNVSGPLARSAGDLKRVLQVCGGPDPADAVALKWEPPPARGTRLRDFRVGYMFDDPDCRPSSEVGAVLEGVLSALSRAGVKLERGWPEGIRPAQQFYSYGFLIGALTNAGLPEEEVERLRSRPEALKDPYAAAAFQPHRFWLKASMDRLAARQAWHRYFRNHDIFLTPTAFVPAFPHIPESDFNTTRLSTPEGERPYMDMIYYVAPFSFSGIPATSAPAGKTRGHLPVGVQIAGPWMEDWTPIAFAEALAEVVGGYEAPPGYKGSSPGGA